MLLKVDHEELFNFTNVINKDSEKAKRELDNMTNCVERLKTIWEGEDASIFCTNFENFIKKVKGIPATMDTISKMCDESNNGYRERDKEFAKALEREAIENE